MWTTSFWKAAGERAIKTFAQTAVALIGVGALVPITEIGWQAVALTSATAAVLSILTSIASNNFGEPGPSLGQETDVLFTK